MKKIIINQAKPNPIGKDRFGHLTPNLQKNGEWVDVKNTGDENYSLNGIKLQHLAYSPTSIFGIRDDVKDLNGTLKPGEVIRVHSGEKTPTIDLLPEDRIGADYHFFTYKDYVWNNDRSDSPRLVYMLAGQTIEIDKATYKANPPEGKILKRVGNELLYII